MKRQFIKHITRSFSDWHVAGAPPFQTYLPLGTFLQPWDACRIDSPTFEELGEAKKQNKTKPLKMSMFILKCYMKSLVTKIFCKQNHWCFSFECPPTSISSTTLPPSFFTLPYPFPKYAPLPQNPQLIGAPLPHPSLSPLHPLSSLPVQPLLWTLGFCHPVSIPSFSLILFHFPQSRQSWWSVNQGAPPQLIQVEGCCPGWGHLVSASPQGFWILSRRSQREKGGTDSASDGILARLHTSLCNLDPWSSPWFLGSCS